MEVLVKQTLVLSFPISRNILEGWTLTPALEERTGARSQDVQRKAKPCAVWKCWVSTPHGGAYATAEWIEIEQKSTCLSRISILIPPHYISFIIFFLLNYINYSNESCWFGLSKRGSDSGFALRSSKGTWRHLACQPLDSELELPPSLALTCADTIFENCIIT